MTRQRTRNSAFITRRALLFGSALAPLAFSQTARADDIDAIRGRGVLRIGTSGDYAPFSSATGKTFVGFDVELGKRVAKDFGVRAEFVRFTWPELVQALKTGQFDLAMSGITLRGDRCLAGRFSRPYAVTAAVALIRPGDRARFADPSALDHDGVRLVVNAGGHLENIARQQFPRAQISTTTDNTRLLTPVLGKIADAAISDSAEAHAHATSGLVSVGPLSHDRKALLVADAAESFAGWTDHWLRERERDGFLPTLRNRYLGSSKEIAVPLSAEAVFGDIQLRCELMPLVGACKAAHGLPVEDAAQEARVLARMESAARGAGLDSETVQGLYRVLMASAKDIEQARASEPSAATPTLDELRASIRVIDAQLLAELQEGLRRTASVDWRPLADRCITVGGLSSARKSEIGDALAKVRLAS